MITIKPNKGYFPDSPIPPVSYLLACLLAWCGTSVALAEDYTCEQSGETHIWISPINPAADAPVKIMAIATDGPIAELTVIDSQGHHIPLQSRHRGGPPWSLSTALERLAAEQYRVVAHRDGKPIACYPLIMGESNKRENPKVWNLATEAFYSAWIEMLFGVPYSQKAD